MPTHEFHCLIRELNHRFKNYEKIIFIESDLIKSTGPHYIHSHYNKAFADKIDIISWPNIYFPSISLVVLSLFMILLSPLLYVRHLFREVSPKCDSRVLLVGRENSLAFLCNSLIYDCDIYAIDTLQSYYDNKFFTSRNYLYYTLIYASIFVDSFYYFTSNRYYYLNTFNPSLFVIFFREFINNKFYPLPIGINPLYLKSHFTDVSLSRPISIGIYSNYAFAEHQIFMSRFFHFFSCNVLASSAKLDVFVYGANSRLVRPNRELLMKINTLNPNINFEFGDFINDLPDWLNRRSAFILPSFTASGIKIKLYELFTIGKPFICAETLIHHLPIEIVRLCDRSSWFNKENMDISLLNLIESLSNNKNTVKTNFAPFTSWFYDIPSPHTCTK